jgi:CheY-like chemotaxis protein
MKAHVPHGSAEFEARVALCDCVALLLRHREGQRKFAMARALLVLDRLMIDRPSILIADDDEDMRTLLAAMFESDGYIVRTAASGADLLDLLGRVTVLDRPNVIVADVLMPGYSGLQVLGAVRSAGWSIPIILISAHRNEQLRENAARLGVTAFIQKPFDPADIRVAVARSLYP